jgi:hypothetical protein
MINLIVFLYFLNTLTYIYRNCAVNMICRLFLKKKPFLHLSVRDPDLQEFILLCRIRIQSISISIKNKDPEPDPT